MCEVSQGMPAECCTRVGERFFSMYYQSQSPKVISRNLQSRGDSYFLMLFLGEAKLHPEPENGSAADHRVCIPRGGTAECTGEAPSGTGSPVSIRETRGD